MLLWQEPKNEKNKRKMGTEWKGGKREIISLKDKGTVEFLWKKKQKEKKTKLIHLISNNNNNNDIYMK